MGRYFPMGLPNHHQKETSDLSPHRNHHHHHLIGHLVLLHLPLHLHWGEPGSYSQPSLYIIYNQGLRVDCNNKCTNFWWVWTNNSSYYSSNIRWVWSDDSSFCCSNIRWIWSNNSGFYCSYIWWIWWINSDHQCSYLWGVWPNTSSFSSSNLWWVRFNSDH